MNFQLWSKADKQRGLSQISRQQVPDTMGQECKWVPTYVFRLVLGSLKSFLWEDRRASDGWQILRDADRCTGNDPSKCWYEKVAILYWIWNFTRHLCNSFSNGVICYVLTQISTWQVQQQSSGLSASMQSVQPVAPWEQNDSSPAARWLRRKLTWWLSYETS